jgi:hypothetical protein
VRLTSLTRRGGAVACVVVLTPVLAASAAITGPRILATGGTPQSAAVHSAFAHKLSARVVGVKGNPRVGLLVTFRAPASGASLTFANGRTSWTHRTGKHGYVRVAATANGTTGSYKVIASLHSTPVRTAAFSLTNTP